jgi:hypothetical protein
VGVGRGAAARGDGPERLNRRGGRVNRTRGWRHRTRTAKAAGIDVERYLEDLLYRIDDPKSGGVEKMTPWAWAEERRREAAEQGS